MSKHKGLTEQQVEQSRSEHGENIITTAKKESVWKLFADKFRDPIIRILLIAAGLSLVIAFFDGEYIETIGICVAIILATGVAFWFEYDAMKRFEVLSKVSDDFAVKVVRGGKIVEVSRREVVVGDVVVIESGEEVPADGKLLESVSLSVNESTLTGEQMTRKTADAANFKKDSTYPSDMLLRGTTVVEGHGIMVVEAVGDSTEYGQVARNSTAPKTEKTPLEKQLIRLSGIIGKYGMWISIAVFAILIGKGFIIGDFAGGDWLHIFRLLLSYFMVAVVLMVMAIPEGLPMSITLSLAMSMRRMIKTNNLVRKMHACETMGAVTVICTDKTGTLTENKMRVDQTIEYGQSPQGLLDELFAVNSTAFIDDNDKVIGNPTEGALLLSLKDKGVDYSTLRGGAKIIDQMTFTTERKYMATIAVSAVTGQRMLYVKGAPEIVGAMAYEGGLPEEMAIQLAEFQCKAMRTLGFAWKQTDSDSCEDAIAECGMTFAGISAISDPVRADVPAAVADCRNAGIGIKIVTGDTPETAREIARRIGLWGDEDTDANRMTGPEFAAMSDEELLGRIKDLKIMARARPLDKERLVQLLQQQGEVVAVTGDGTNDAPALNAANVGLSMGSGTSVAMQASDITLLDDSFATIATAVMWGRSLYKNIQRFVLFQLTVNFTALVVVFIGSIFGSQSPLTVTQILWVNIIMDTFAAMALASLPPNPAVMKEKPRAHDDFIITRHMVKVIVWTGSLFVAVLLGMLYCGRDLVGEALTSFMSLFFTTFVFLQFWNLFNARIYCADDLSQTSFRQSKGFLLILLLIAVGQYLIVTFGGPIFRTVPLTWQQWLWAAGATSIVALLGLVTRRSTRR